MYRKDRNQQFLSHMQEALKVVASANDERNESFPLDLQKTGNGISRLAAHLHIFHHQVRWNSCCRSHAISNTDRQCIVLATRPLLFSFWQQRLRSAAPLRIASYRGARSLLRVCVGSAKQTIDILEALQSQSLLGELHMIDAPRPRTDRHRLREFSSLRS